MRALLVAVLPLVLTGCTAWLLSGYDRVDRSRPVALVETTGGVEYGATTEFGILTLGRTAKDGPCRVHYFLGPTPLIEDGHVVPTGSVFCRALMDLKTQHLRVLDHTPGPDEDLLAMWTTDGIDTEEVSVELSRDDGVLGDVLDDPGRELPAGAAIFATDDDDGRLRFVGLVSGRATVRGPGGPRSYYVFAGVDRVRELLALPEVHPVDYEVEFRPDDISVRRPIRLTAPAAPDAATTAPTPPAGSDGRRDQ
ncbi:MAG: hypothetical protein AB7O97_10915 [Planctomycetota bacterium]